VTFVFALASSAVGSSGEYIPFVLILVALCRAMRMDAMTAVGMIVAGYGIGYGMASFNQYTVVVAQGIAEVPTYSGAGVKLALLVPFVLIGVHHVWSYAREGPGRPGAEPGEGTWRSRGSRTALHLPGHEPGSTSSSWRASSGRWGWPSTGSASTGGTWSSWGPAS
jgi:hypothetical protein